MIHAPVERIQFFSERAETLKTIRYDTEEERFNKQPMADFMRDIYPLISKPLRVAQQQMNWLKGFQAQQQQNYYSRGYGNNDPYSYTNFSNGWGQGYPPYNSASSFQMQQLQDLLRIYGQGNSTPTPTPPSNGNSDNNMLMNLLLPLLLQKLFSRKSSSGSTNNDDDTPSTPTNPAVTKINELLAKSAADDGTADSDNDNLVISPADFASLKASLNDNAFTKAQLESALSDLMLTSDLGKVDELTDLLAMAQDDGLVDMENILTPSLLGGLSPQRKELLATSLASKGLVKGSNGNNQDMITYIINSLDKPADSSENAFAKLLVQKLVNRWIVSPQQTLPNPDTSQLHNLLKLLGFKYLDDGVSLAADNQQPFPIGIENALIETPPPPEDQDPDEEEKAEDTDSP